MNRVLVTGASGFIGQHLVRTLSGQGNEAYALDRNRNKLLFLKGRVFECDIFDKKMVKEAVKKANIVVHLVAKTHDPLESAESSKEYFKINVEGTRSILDACIDSEIKHFIYFSSIKAVTEKTDSIIDETFIPSPTTVYGKSKLEAEHLVDDYGKKYGFKTTLLRLPMVYGPGNKGNIFKMIEAIDRNRFVMIGSGDNIRSMVYAGNVVDATALVIEKQRENSSVFIVTDGTDYSVKDLYKTITSGLGKNQLSLKIPVNFAKLFALIGEAGERIFGKSLPLNISALEKLTSSLILSSKKIQTELEFIPKYNLYNTISETIRWYREQ